MWWKILWHKALHMQLWCVILLHPMDVGRRHSVRARAVVRRTAANKWPPTRDKAVKKWLFLRYPSACIWIGRSVRTRFSDESDFGSSRTMGHMRGMSVPITLTFAVAAQSQTMGETSRTDTHWLPRIFRVYARSAHTHTHRHLGSRTLHIASLHHIFHFMRCGSQMQTHRATEHTGIGVQCAQTPECVRRFFLPGSNEKKK